MIEKLECVSNGLGTLPQVGHGHFVTDLPLLKSSPVGPCMGGSNPKTGNAVGLLPTLKVKKLSSGRSFTGIAIRLTGCKMRLVGTQQVGQEKSIIRI